MSVCLPLSLSLSVFLVCGGEGGRRMGDGGAAREACVRLPRCCETRAGFVRASGKVALSSVAVACCHTSAVMA